MTNLNDQSTFSARVSGTSDELSGVADSQQKWLTHLDTSLEAVNTDLKSRIREIRERHRRARQEISDDLQALAQEIGFLPPPTYESLRTEFHVTADDPPPPASVAGITYIDQYAEPDPETESEPDVESIAQRFGLRGAVVE
jgi:hypothetical protein